MMPTGYTYKDHKIHRAKFLKAISNGDSINHAVKAAGLGRSTVYRWRDEYEDFRLAWEEAIEDGIERLEDAAYQRALEGSDTLMIFLLKAKKPKIYSDRQRLEHTGADGAPLGLNVKFIDS